MPRPVRGNLALLIGGVKPWHPPPCFFIETVLGSTLCAVKMRAPLVKLFAGNARTAPVPVRGLMTRWQTSVCGKPKPEGVALALFIETVLLSLQRGRRIGGNNS